MIIGLDTETTGVDLAHGAKPFLVTWCEYGRSPECVVWPVDPKNREPAVDQADVERVVEIIDAADTIYLQSAKFDYRSLAKVGIDLPWSKVRDTLCMGHLLGSNLKHDLTSMLKWYLRVDVQSFEVAVKRVTQECRAIAKRDFPDWLLADEGIPSTPSVKPSSDRKEDKPWKADMWLPAALANHLVVNGLMHEAKIPREWLDAVTRYACSDSKGVLYLGIEMEKLIREKGYWKIYEHRLNLPRVAAEMEDYGTTVVGSYTRDTMTEYEEHIVECEEVLRDIAREYDYDLQLAAGAGLNDNMREFFYGSEERTCPHCGYSERVKHWNGEQWKSYPDAPKCPKCAKGTKRKPAVERQLVTTRRPNLALPVVFHEKTGNATLNAAALQDYTMTLEEGNALDFIEVLLDKRKYDTSLSYMRGYERFWIPVPGHQDFYRLHPSINPFGTDHLRMACNSPNLQNVGKQEMRCEECDGKGCSRCGYTGFKMRSARHCFGPVPDREWWSMDFSSIEDRIPAYECTEPAMVEVFERPKDPPYWGSRHNVTCSLLWPELYFGPNHNAKIGPVGGDLSLIKDGFKNNYINEYKRAKNTNFAKNYGAGKKKVDATAQVVGAFERIDRGMPRLAELQRRYLKQAQKLGYVETLPDRSVDPDRGYPLLPSRTEDGRVLSTTPFNYHVSGTACWAKNAALVRCSAKCAQWRSEGFDAHISLEIHDEILFDFPRGKDMSENRWRAMELRELMEQSGRDLVPQIPTPVSVEYHTECWGLAVAT